MQKQTCFSPRLSDGRTCAWLLLAWCFLGQPLAGQTDPVSLPERRIFIPQDELDVVLERDRRGVLMPQAEFRKLVEQARKTAAARGVAPTPLVLDRCEYTAKIVGDQLLITVKAELEQLVDDWQSWSFPLQRLAVEQARLNDEPALVGREKDGALTLLTAKRGAHVLELQLSTEIITLGSDQAAAFSLMGSAAGELAITLPAGKRLLVDGLQWERPAAADQPADYRIPVGGRQAVQLRITDRDSERKADALIFATTGYGLFVAPGEVTWHALTTLQIFGKPMDRMTFAVPSTLEIAEVESTGLESWDMRDDPETPQRTLITLTFGQPVEGSRKISFRGVMSAEAGTSWTVPPLTVIDATSHVGQVVLQYPAGVRLQIQELDGVRRSTLQHKAVSDMPTDMGPLKAAESLRFDVWREDFTLRMLTQPKAREVHAAVAAVLDVASTGITLQTALTLTPRFAPLFDVDLDLPAEWTVVAAYAVDNQPLKWELIPQAAGTSRYRFALRQPLPPGVEGVVKLELRREVEGWPVEAEPITFPLPELVLPQSTLTETALIVRGDADLELAAEEFLGLDPDTLKAEWERLRFQSQDTRYSGRLKVTRKPARLAAQTISFYRLDPQTLHVASFALVTVDGGGARQVIVSLPETVGANVVFQMPGLVEQQPLPALDGRLRWRLQLAERLRGGAILTTVLELPRKAGDTVEPPVLTIEETERQFGALVIEAGPEQQLTMKAVDAAGIELAETDPVDLPPVAYLPKERIVAAFRTTAPGARLQISEERFDKAAVPTAVCKLLQLQSILSRTGELQHRAEFQLLTAGVPQVRLTLPAETQLWAALVNGAPVEVRRLENDYLLPLTAVQGEAQLTVSLFYRGTTSAFSRAGTFTQSPPALAAVLGQGQIEPIEVLEQTWDVSHPDDTLLIASRGTLEPTGALDEAGWLAEWREWIKAPSFGSLLQGGFVLVVTAGAIALVVLLIQRRGWRGGIEAGAVIGSIGVLSLCVLSTTSRMSHESMGIVPMATTKSAAPYGRDDAVADVSESATPQAEMPMPTAAPMTAPIAPPQEPRLEVLNDMVAADEQAPMNGEPQNERKLKELDRRRAAEKDLSKAIEEREEMVASKVRAIQDLKKQSGENAYGNRNRFAQPGANSRTPALFPQGGAEAKPDSYKNTKDQTQWQVDQDADALAEGLVMQQAQLGDKRERGEVRDMDGLIDLNMGRRGGLLSLSLILEAPPGSQTKRFRSLTARGAGERGALELDYVDRRAGRVFRWLLFAAGLVAGWYSRRWTLGAKLSAAVALFAVSCGLMPIVPVTLHVLLDGLFAAGCGVVFSWLIFGIGRCCDWICSCCCRSAALLLLAVFLGMQGTASAQPVSQQPAVPQTAPDVAPNAAANPGPTVPTPRPPVPAPRPGLLLPYVEGQPPLDAERIWLPHEKFMELYRLANPDKLLLLPAPIAGRIVEGWYQAALTGPVVSEAASVTVTARLVIRSAVDGQWSTELPFHNVALTSAKLNGQPAALQSGAGKLTLIVPKAGLHVFDAEFSVPAKVLGPSGSFTLPLTATPAAKLAFLLPQKESSVRINGSTTIYRRLPDADPPRIELPVDRGGDFQISWQPDQAQGAGAAVVHVESVTAATIDDAGVKLSAGFKYRVRQGIIRDVALNLPEAVRLQSVNGPDVGGWELVGAGAERRLRIFLRRNVGDATELTVETYLPYRVQPTASSLVIPEIAPLQITAEVGHVAVYAGDEFTLRPEGVTGLVQVEAANYQPAVPVSRLAVAPQFLYRFSKRPWALQVSTMRRSSQLQVSIDQGHRIADRKIRTTSRIVCELGNVPRSAVELKVPTGWVILDVQSAGLRDWFLSTANDQPLLTLEYETPREGAVEVIVLSTQTRDPADPAVNLSALQVTGALRTQRQAAVWLDAGLSAQIQNLGKWRTLDASTVCAELKSLQPAAAQLAFESTLEDPGTLQLTVGRATPRLVGESLTAITVTDVALVYGLIFQWEITQATTDQLILETPGEFAGKLDFQGANLRDVAVTTQANGTARWVLSLRSPVSGSYTLTASATMPPPAERIAAPVIQLLTSSTTPAPLETQRRFVLLINTSLSQLILATPDAAEAVQREDLDIVVRPEMANQATQFVRLKDSAGELAWTLQRYQPTAGIPASVNLADITTILARDGSYRSSVAYTVKNRSRQFLPVELPQDARLLSVFVGDAPSRSVRTTLDGKTIDLIALPKTGAADLSFRVTLFLSGQLKTTLPHVSIWSAKSIDVPTPRVIGQEENEQFGIPVARTRWVVYLPDDLVVSPLRDPLRHNLNQHQQGGDADSYSARALLQDYSEILSNYDSLSSDRTRYQARNNLKQLESSLVQEFDAKGGKDAALGEERRKLQQRLNELETRSANPQAFDVNTHGALQSQDAEQQLGIAGTNNSILFFDNGGQGLNIQNGRGVVVDGTAIINGEADFNFRLKSEASQTEAAAKAAEQAQTKLRSSGNLDARNYYRQQNDTQLENLNRDISGKKLAIQNNFSKPSSATPTDQAPAPGLQPPAAGDPFGTRPSGQPGPQSNVDGPVSGSGTVITNGLPQFRGYWIDGGKSGNSLQLGGAGGGGMGGGFGGNPDGGVQAQGRMDLPAPMVNGPGLGLMNPTNPAGWSRSGGLSLTLALPTDGQQLVFAKAGGDARLALQLRPQETISLALGSIWTIGCLGLAFVVYRAAQRPGSLRSWGPLCVAIVSAIAFLTLAAPLCLFAFLVFLGSCLVLAWNACWSPRTV